MQGTPKLLVRFFPSVVYTLHQSGEGYSTGLQSVSKKSSLAQLPQSRRAAQQLELVPQN